MQNRKHLAALVCCCVLAAAFALFPAQRAGGQADSETPPPWLDGVDIVYVTKTGYCYHAIPDCGYSKYIRSINRSEAVRIGYQQCSNCKPSIAIPGIINNPLNEDNELIVYIMVEDDHYHANASCEAFDPSEDGRVFPHVPVTLEEAYYLIKKPCRVCKPIK
jgi:hypothetical protein